MSIQHHSEGLFRYLGVSQTAAAAAVVSANSSLLACVYELALYLPAAKSHRLATR